MLVLREDPLASQDCNWFWSALRFPARLMSFSTLLRSNPLRARVNGIGPPSRALSPHSSPLARTSISHRRLSSSSSWRLPLLLMPKNDDPARMVGEVFLGVGLQEET